MEPSFAFEELVRAQLALDEAASALALAAALADHPQLHDDLTVLARAAVAEGDAVQAVYERHFS